jgi:hypothetical protein
MGKRDLPTSNTSYPWDEKEVRRTAVRCPGCGNDGMDGTITGHRSQYALLRECLKCGRKWNGGIGVQRANLAHPPPTPGVNLSPEEPKKQSKDPSYRDPRKTVRDEDE